MAEPNFHRCEIDSAVRKKPRMGTKAHEGKHRNEETSRDIEVSGSFPLTKFGQTTLTAMMKKNAKKNVAGKKSTKKKGGKKKKGNALNPQGCGGGFAESSRRTPRK